MAGEHDASPTAGGSAWVHLGMPVLESGYTLVPNLLLDHYATLGLTEGTALFVIRLLRQGADRQGMLLDSPQMKDHLRALQDKGLLTVRRQPDGVELRLDALFHNLARLADWLAEGRAPAEFEIEIPAGLPTEVESPTDRFDSAEFEAEVTDVLAAFAAANCRAASPAEKEHIRNLAVRFDAAARVAVEPSNGPAWVMAALRAALEQKPPSGISVSDLEQALERRLTGANSVPSAHQATKAVRQQVTARVRKMSAQEKEALGTVVMAYQGIAGHPPDDQLVLTLMQLSDEYGPPWVLSAIHETGKVQQLISPEYIESILVRWRSEGRIRDASVAAESAPVTDPLLARVTAMYEQEVGPLTPQTRDQLLALTQEFRDADEWARAFAAAAKSNARNLRYVEAVLRKKGRKPSPSARRSAKSRPQRRATREGVWTEEELEAARREALSEPTLDPQTFFDEES